MRQVSESLSIPFEVTNKARREELKTMQIVTAPKPKKNDSASALIQGQERGLNSHESSRTAFKYLLTYDLRVLFGNASTHSSVKGRVETATLQQQKKKFK